MIKPVLTVVVPTCDRPDTLGPCLRALAKQANPEIEILVHDNASDEETKRVIQSVNDPRIVHIRLPQRVSMRENFELATATAKGDYISMIGDDDAYSAGALDWIVNMAKQHRPDAIRWRLAAYYWPSLCDANLGFFWLHYDYFYGGWSWHSKAELTQKLLAGQLEGLGQQSLMIYHGVVSRQLYETTKSQTGGVFFGYHIPDMYVHTSLLLSTGANLSGQYIDVDHPLSIYGLSGHSNGSSWNAGASEKRGEKSPMSQWTKTATADTQVAYTVLTPIRSEKFHSYIVLTMMEKHGMVEPDLINHANWVASIIKETSENLWQLRGFREAIPVRDSEKKAVAAVLEHFKDVGSEIPEEPPRLKHLYPESWKYRQLCSKAVFPDRKDDVETAVDVLDAIVKQKMGLGQKTKNTELVARVMRQHLTLQVKDAFEARPMPPKP
jgi:Glycosyl transferase family 2